MAEQSQETVESHSRRRFFKYGAAAAATSAAAAVASAVPAGAANGSNLVIGVTTNNGTLTTRLTGSQFAVRNGNNGVSVYGESIGSTVGSSGIGVKGFAENGGTGVYGEGGTSSVAGIGVRAASAQGAPLKIDEGTRSFPPTGGTWGAGSFGVDGGHLFYCYAGGTGSNSKWARLSAAPVALSSNFRVYDSRPGRAPAAVTKGKLNNGATRNVSISLNGNVPSNASLVMGNLTVVETSSGGYLSLYPAGVAWPGNSSINWTAPNTTLANSFAVRPSAAGLITVRASGSCHFLMDITAYFT